MNRSTKPTNHILIKASTTSKWDKVAFAIIDLRDPFRAVMSKRLSVVSQFESDECFHNLCYWDSPMGYYNSQGANLGIEEIILEGQDWAFINLDLGEAQTFTTPKNQLEGHQLVITKYGYANFKAFSKYTTDEYFTESFSIAEVLNNHSLKSINSS